MAQEDPVSTVTSLRAEKQDDWFQQYQMHTANTTVLLLVFIWATGFSLGSDNHSGPLQLNVI